MRFNTLSWAGRRERTWCLGLLLGGCVQGPRTTVELTPRPGVVVEEVLEQPGAPERDRDRCPVQVRVGGSHFLLQRAEYTRSATQSGNIVRYVDSKAIGFYARLLMDAKTADAAEVLQVNCLSLQVVRTLQPKDGV